MTQEDSVQPQKGHHTHPSRLTTYLCAGAVLIAAVWGMRQGVRWWKDAPFRRMERRVGFHLYRPTYLPHRMKLAQNGIIKGVFRVVWAYSSDERSVHVGQEKRTPERDQYNRRTFKGQRAKVNRRPATFSRDQFGAWRLFWQMDDVTIILSSGNLKQEELIQIAESMQ